MAEENSSMNTAAVLDLPSGLDDWSIPDYFHGDFPDCAKKQWFEDHNRIVSSLE